MNANETNPYSKQVDAWIKQNTEGQSPDRLLRFFGEAIKAIQKRAGTPLSEVTLTAIFDRVLHAGQQKFPLLSGLRIDAKGISLDTLMAQSAELKSEDVIGAFQFLLVELLTLLGNLTADILTTTLYAELFNVTMANANSGPRFGQRVLKGLKGSSGQGNV